VLLGLQFLMFRRNHCALILRIHLTSNLILKMDPLKHQQMVAQQHGIIHYRTKIFSSALLTMLPQLKILLLCHFTTQ